MSQSSSASYLLLYATGNMDSQHHVFEFCISVEVTMDVIVSFFCSSGQKEAVGSVLTVPNDDSGILSRLGVIGLAPSYTQCGDHRLSR